MGKAIETQKISIDNKNFYVKYIVPDDMYIVTPYTEDKIIQNKLLEKLKLDKSFKINSFFPEKTQNSIAQVESALIISRVHK